VGSSVFHRQFRPVIFFGILSAVFAGVCVAPQTPPEPPARDRAALARVFVAEKLARWQRQLKLEDWSISVVMTQRQRLRRGTLGSIRWDAGKKAATIRVLDPADYQVPYRAMLKDMEFTLVHELIHLELASLPRSEASRTDEEFAVNNVASALIALDDATR
jgi:hypothetical protein